MTTEEGLRSHASSTTFDNISMAAAYLLLFWAPIVTGLFAIIFGATLLTRRKKWRFIATILVVCGIAILPLNPFVNFFLFRPFAPKGYLAKMGDNEKYWGQRIAAVIREKGQPNRVVTAHGETRWYYDVNKPWFVIELDELYFVVQDDRVQSVAIDFF